MARVGRRSAGRFALRRVAAAWITALAAQPVLAGGGEVNALGHGSVYLGESIKRGVDRFDEDGERFRGRNGRTHDFRYTYLYFELGIAPRLQAQGVLTHLRGCETFDPGTSDDFCHDGFSDQWVALKYQLMRSPSWPLAVEVTARFPDAYMDDDELTSRGKHWLGVYRHDYSLSLHTSHSFGRTWMALSGGTIYREGAPADVLSLRPQVRVPLLAAGWGGLTLNAGIDGYFSLGNESAADDERDRFGDRREELPGHFFSFNDQDFIRPSVGLDIDFAKRWSAGIGYSRIVWGRSAHIYDEGWLQVGYRF